MFICFPLSYAQAQGTTITGPDAPLVQPATPVIPPANPASPPNTVVAPTTPSPGGFVPLTNLPGLSDDTGTRTLADYINVLFRLSIGIGALVAVIKITYAGIQYMGTYAFSSKEQAKKDITSALLGLLIMLSTVVILKLIYPDILNINVLQKLEPVKVQTPTVQQPTPVDESIKEQKQQYCQQNPLDDICPKTGEELANSMQIPLYGPEEFDAMKKKQDDFTSQCKNQNGRLVITRVSLSRQFYCFVKIQPPT